MGTQLQDIQDYTNYIKCGEILKPPLQNFQQSIIFKCFECKEVHFILESFITHIQKHFKDILSLEEHDSKTLFENVHDVEMENDGVGIKNLAIKLEELEDPLIPVKCELGEEKSTNISTKKYDDEFEDVLDSPDEFQPDDDDSDSDENHLKKEKVNKRKKTYTDETESDDSETDEEEVIKKTTNKRKKKTTETSNKKRKNSPDETETDDSETDEEEIIKKPANRRKQKSLDETKSDDSETDADELMEDTSTNKSKIKSPIVEEFIKSKPNVLTLIDLYKNQPNLWDRYSPFYRLKDKRNQFLEDITQELNAKCSLELSSNDTGEILAFICSKHKDDLKKMRYQNRRKKGKKNSKTPRKYEIKSEKKTKYYWFFDHLHFLRSKVVFRMEHLDSDLPDLTSEQIIKILEIYKSFPHLWNTYLIEHICLNKRNDALDEMLKSLEANMNLKISTNVLEQYIHTIHEYCAREKRKKLGISTPDDLQNSSNSSPNYYEHMTFLEDHEGPLSCPECNHIYNKPLCFRIHKAQHDGSPALKCSQCDQECKTVASYTTHAKRHLDDLQFACKECGTKFLRHTDLQKHMVTHTDARPYCCEICGASYRHSTSFRKHQRQHEKRYSHTCHICSKGYYRKYRYIDHMNSHMNIRQHICNICGKGFITSRALKTHAVTHEEARNHACKLCGKTFKLKIGVLQHMRTHGSKVETEKSSLLF
ncbi:zinc finger protein 846-like [Lucilia cuprina]|uniref:zinc finger protein 846-like n=1 Tax=Lucilia cuprina TaxID=7375 RepID=UPI001F054B1A|nr:zinc finger protein 846-like [Lucilia cuprina]